MVRFEAVEKSFEGRVVIHETTLEVGVGERLALIGPSGCGKSTLLRMILGMVKPDRGLVRVGGERVTDANVRAVRRRIGYVIQDGGLFPHLTAEDNVILVARLSGLSRVEIAARVHELADLARLPRSLLHRFPRSLSGGERQRVGLMRALMLDPDVLLLDEPLGALDPIIRAQLQEDLREVFCALKKSVIVVTHDMGEAGYLAESIAVMRAGKVLQRGDVRALTGTPADPFITEFVSAQRSLAEAVR
ncbi:MAG: ATP-binding cassette domain-containing protein [Polyangiaceae bacterium]|nr:ATP-binding cassette domain-containing protein [Polyangiaceae bacterium]